MGLVGMCPSLRMIVPFQQIIVLIPTSVLSAMAMVWVCLEDPLIDIPDISEASDPGYRLIQEFYELWQCAGLRVMENELDLAHPTFVHTTTFGSEEHPTPDALDITETDWGIHVFGKLGVVNPSYSRKI